MREQLKRALIESTLAEIGIELDGATQKFAPFASDHEAYGVITEEYREYETHVFKKAGARDREEMRQELVQIAAMCVRAVVELHLTPNKYNNSEPETLKPSENTAKTLDKTP